MKTIFRASSFLFLLSLSSMACVHHRHNDDQDNTPASPTIGVNEGDGGVSSSTPEDSSNVSIIDAGNPDVYVPHCGDDGMPKCQLDEACRQGSDCDSGTCDSQKVCIKYKSCANYYGGHTCGTGEVGDPKAQHESCCETAPLPSGVKMDKYLMTSGRARAMVEAVNGDFKSWYLAHGGELPGETRAQIDPYADTIPNDMRNGPYSVVAMVNGGNIYIPDLPSNEQGCYEAPGAIGTHTYWLTPEDNALYGDHNGFGQKMLDTLPLNCAPYIFHAILCAYDGGRLQTFEEAQMAWGNATYSWGDLPAPGGFGDNGLVGPANIAPWGPTDPACPSCDSTMMNWLNNYQFPGPLAGAEYDYSYFISAPGRFPKDTGPFGHHDLSGDLIEWTSSVVEGGYVDTKGRGPYIRFNGAGSFEGHQSNYWKWAMLPLVKYGKFGGRCVKY